MHQASCVTELGLALGRDEVARATAERGRAVCSTEGLTPADRLADDTSATPTGRHPLIRQLPNISRSKRLVSSHPSMTASAGSTYAATS